MASLPARVLASFQANIPNPTLNDLDGEFNQLVGAAGIFTGGTDGAKLLVKSSDATDPPLELDQIGAGPLAEWKQAGSLKVSITNAGLLNMVNPAVNTGLNADQVDGIEGANIAKLDTNTIPWSATWFIADPSTAAQATEEYPSLLVPVGSTAFTVTRLGVEYRAGSHTTGGVVVLRLVQRGSASVEVGTIQLDNTNNAPFTLYTADIADFPLAASDRLIFTFSRVNTITERNVSFFAEGTRRLT